MKRLIALTIVLTMALSLVACGETGGGARKASPQKIGMM